MAAMLIKKHKRFWTYKSLTMFSGVKLRKEEVSVFLYFFISVFLSSSIAHFIKPYRDPVHLYTGSR